MGIVLTDINRGAVIDLGTRRYFSWGLLPWRTTVLGRTGLLRSRQMRQLQKIPGLRPSAPEEVRPTPEDCPAPFLPWGARWGVRKPSSEAEKSSGPRRALQGAGSLATLERLQRVPK